MNNKIIEKAKKIKLLAMDIDGVLTAGELIILDNGEEIKVWNVKDRFGFHLLRKSGLDIKLAWITARQSEQVRLRAEDLKIEFLYQKYGEKLKALEEIIRQTGFKYEEIAYLGDDWIDLPLLKRAGLSICPKDSPDEVKRTVDYVSKYDGGKGVFRETVELLFKARDVYKKVIGDYEK